MVFLYCECSWRVFADSTKWKTTFHNICTCKAALPCAFSGVSSDWPISEKLFRKICKSNGSGRLRSSTSAASADEGWRIRAAETSDGEDRKSKSAKNEETEMRDVCFRRLPISNTCPTSASTSSWEGLSTEDGLGFEEEQLILDWEQEVAAFDAKLVLVWWRLVCGRLDGRGEFLRW